ncbi:hypothetical protein [Phaeobacter inhibens]|uniref:hypothetical protein n=1 Tax=Phaeobacter inhibens TaxID=221822 RepID=UPI000C9A4FAD|nr:hypothetical protein [Phaeobacter inhibens]AUQ63397.1 hypothetical protein PhaeoP51_02429 [Phaeobacter inhibens]AUQ83303.1 hypothetical protein PhaeoP57_02390 [Phaeobacter inhibens]AUQ91062.1 hypothetical protein PhaeoP24_02462 [Phaeobacter inhibens]MDO6757351.1 hypothetical protein [Phaeobacter inhibens]
MGRVGDIEILEFEKREIALGKATLWVTINSTAAEDIPLQTLSFLLAYTVNPGGTFMKGGNGIMSWTLRNPARKNTLVPANQKVEICIYEDGDPVELIWKNDLKDQCGNIRKNYDWLCSEVTEKGALLDVLVSAPTTIWLEIRAPDWRLRNRNSKKKLVLQQS